jgi:L-aminopeptidase/D-esterase-like protein
MKSNRRHFIATTGAAFAIAGAHSFAQERRSASLIESDGTLTSVTGIRVGHAVDPRRPTGVTAILFDRPATAGADYDGSAPGEMLGVMLQPVSPLDRIHGILLTGGGPMGLGAVAGVVQHLERQNIGYDWGVPNVRIPIVVGAVIDDLSVGDGRIRPDPALAGTACEAASTAPVPEGSVGAGAGATVGKMFRGSGLGGMKGGLGTAALKRGSVVVAALSVVNAAGDVVDWRSGQIVAGARGADGRAFADSMAVLRQRLAGPSAHAIADAPLRATTLTVIATNVTLDKTRLTKLAMMTNTGAARAVRPYHTDGDGDQVIAISTGEIERGDLSLTAIGAAAADMAATAIVRGVLTATGVEGWPAVRDIA